ncbi:MAG: hypothetical protein ACHQM6_07915, partial [Candidatus Kapaibacterium sp.]
QKTNASSVDIYPPAKFSEKEMYRFDIARPIKHFDALPDGSDWFAVDEFALTQTMIVRGVRFEKRFNEIPKATARFSPAGDYLIWMGLERSFDSKGFNTTTTSVYRSTMASTEPDSIGSFTSDYNTLYFSASGKHWAATLPAASVYQKGLRDVVLVDGLIVSKGNPLPGMFSFDRNETGWAYRSTDGRDENLVTQYALQKMYTRSKSNPYVESSDPVVYHFSPDLKTTPNQFESRDYDFDYRHSAQLYKTTYLSSRQDTAHQYIIYANKREPNFRWISNIQIDTGGSHIAYFAADTAGEDQIQSRNTKACVVVEDGNIIAGPYDEEGRLFLSPSGKNIAWSAKKDGKSMLYFNGGEEGEVGDYVELYWSSDEKKIAYLTNDDRGKNYIVAGGKRSPKFDRIGRVGWSSDKKTVEFCAINYDKLLQIRQQF